MSLVSQIAGMTVLASIPDSTSPLATIFSSQDSLRFRRRFGRYKYAFRPECRLVCMRPCGAENVVTWQAQSHSVITIIGFCPTPSSVFDTRLHPVTGSGHIRRPGGTRSSALPAAPVPGLGSSQNKFVSRGTERRTNFFRAPPRKQTFGAWEPGPLARLRPV